MDEVTRLSWIALTAVNGFGARTICTLHNYLTKHDIDWGEIWVSNQEKLLKYGFSQKLIDSIFIFNKEYTIYTYYEWLKNNEIEPVLKGDAEYPPLLAALDYSPVVLFRKGQQMLWQEQPVVAVVGTRKMTAYGHLVTTKITRELAHLGATIVSGFMYGVDVTAHTACLAAGGKTVAILGYGFEYCYPVTQQQLLKEMLDRGASFVTPFAPHIPPKKGLFVARNRIVAGMSHAVVVTEAAQRSGSHITAGYAADEGKVVCAVPGPITNPYSEGTKWLVNQGAVLVQSGLEVITECGGVFEKKATRGFPLTQQNAPALNPILHTLKTGSFSTDELVNLQPVHYTSVITQLTTLELEGKIKKEGGRWSLAT